MSLTEEADQVVSELAALHEACRVRADQIAIAALYWRAVRVRDALREMAAA